MDKDLGTKHVCFKCKAKFYDLKKPAAICPKCGADQRDMPPVVVTKAPKKAPAPVKVVEPEGAEGDAPGVEADADDAEEEVEDDDEA